MTRREQSEQAGTRAIAAVKSWQQVNWELHVLNRRFSRILDTRRKTHEQT
jgi:hypothetical protein